MQITKNKAANIPELDTLDYGIIECLRSNPRAANQDIAEKLSVTPATVSWRLRRMEKLRAMRVVAVTDFAAHGYNMLAAVGVKVQGRSVKDVAKQLARLPEVLSVNIMSGAHDIELLVALRDFAEVNLFLIDHVAGVKGVASLAPGIAADIVKFEFNVVPL
jgi:Lrp/AsnC family transcriptional regulator for asnA, asnC and gidA